MRIATTTIILIVISACLAACAAMSDREEDLDKAQRAYEGALRWGHYDSAYAMHAVNDAAPPTAPAQLANIRVTAYNVLSRTLAPDKLHAEQLVEIKYYHIDYLRERTLDDRQAWAWDAQRHAWRLTSPPPSFVAP